VFSRRPAPLQIWQASAKFNCTTTAKHTGHWNLQCDLGPEFFLLTQGGILDTVKEHVDWLIITWIGARASVSDATGPVFTHAEVLRTPYKASLLVRTPSSLNSWTTGYEIL
jgi:hypothetical protein